MGKKFIRAGKSSAPGLSQSPDEPSRGGRWIHWLLIAVTLVTFGAVVTHGFGPVDDVSTISENPKLNPPRFESDSILWYWSHPHMGLYIPVTYTVWGLLAKTTWVSTPDEAGHFLDARIFHAANLLAHMLSVLAVYGILLRLLRRPWPAAAGALLFAIHPLQVEAVAWASGLKDVMCGMFALTALWLYIRAVQPHVGSASADGTAAITDALDAAMIPSAKADPTDSARRASLPLDYQRRGEKDALPHWPEANARRLYYLLGIVSMLMAMLCKPSAMVTPFLAMILDYGILRRPARQVIRSVAPWFVLAIPLAVVAKLVQPGAGIATPPLLQRPVVAGASLAFYLWKLLLPVGLTFDYGWEPMAMLKKGWFWAIALAPLLLAAIFWLRRWRWGATAALISVAALLPVLGFVPFLFQYYSTVADHYVYLAMLGPALVLACALSRVPPSRWRLATTICCGGFALLAAITALQLTHWQDEKTMLLRMLKVTPRSALGHNGLGKWHERRRDFATAIREYQTAIAIDPRFLPPRENLANIYSYLGRVDDAIDQIHALMAIHATLPPSVREDYGGAFFEVGQITLSRGRYADAARYFAEDLKLHPNHAEAKEGLRRAHEELQAASTRAATTRTTP